MEQGVDAREAVGDAELGVEDGSNVLGAEGADAVGRRRPGVEPLAEASDLRLRQERGLAGPGAVGQRIGPLGVVAGDPSLDGPSRGPQRRGDLRGGQTRGRQVDGPEPEERRLFLSASARALNSSNGRCSATCMAGLLGIPPSSLGPAQGAIAPNSK